jgi:hypothetical protein
MKNAFLSQAKVVGPFSTINILLHPSIHGRDYDEPL